MRFIAEMRINCAFTASVLYRSDLAKNERDSTPDTLQVYFRNFLLMTFLKCFFAT